MLVLNSGQLQAKLRAWLEARMIVLLVGPPGTGKTFTAFKVATGMGRPVETVNGGDESDWKSLFPYKTPGGAIELGKALRASGYVIEDGRLEKKSEGGTLVVDEANRVPPELKSAFQLLASQRIVPWPEGGTISVELAIVSTGNNADLGVEESSRAELDRYDIVCELSPTPEEQANIVSGEAGVSREAAIVIYEAVTLLSGKLDPKKVHLPEGLRMAISIAKILQTNTLGPVDCFRAAAERCFPLGRRGAEKHRAEFDSAVADVAGIFAGKLANLGGIAPAAAKKASPAAGAQVATLADLLASLAECTLSQVSAPALTLPRGFSLMMHVFVTCFGLGVAKHLSERKLAGAQEAERSGVKLHFGNGGVVDSVEFLNADRYRVERFCQACGALP